MIIFNYKISDFIDNAQVLSLYRVNTLLESKSENVVDDTAVSDEDESLSSKYLKAACVQIAQIISGYTKDLLQPDGTTILMEGSPFEFDVTYETVEHSIVFRINMSLNFNKAIITAMDEAIKDALESFVLYRTARTKGIEFISYQEDWENSIGQVRNYINRRTTGTRRNYNLI
jgi:hypothetical protein